MNENRQTKRGLCLMMLHNTFTYHCFSCDVKPDRVSAREQYLHLLKVSSCKEYRIAFGNSLKFWSGMYACWSWHYCCCFCFLCFLLRCPCRYHPCCSRFFPTIAWWAKARSSCHVWRSCNCTSSCCCSKLSTIKKTCSSQRKSPSSPWKTHEKKTRRCLEGSNCGIEKKNQKEWKFSKKTMKLVKYSLHHGRLTWNLLINHLERKMIFQTSMIVFQPLIFQGCNSSTALLDWISFFLEDVLAVGMWRLVNLEKKTFVVVF